MVIRDLFGFGETLDRAGKQPLDPRKGAKKCPHCGRKSNVPVLKNRRPHCPKCGKAL